MALRTAPGTGLRSGDDGITLAELLVSMVIMSMIVLATVTLTVSMQRTDSSTFGRTDDTTTAQYAMRVISRTVPYGLRPAAFADTMSSPVLAADENDLAMLIRDPETGAEASPSPSPDPSGTANLLLVQLEISDGQLTERRTSVADVANGSDLLALLPLSSACASRDCETRVLVDGTEDGSGFRLLGEDGGETTSLAAARSVEVTLVVRTAPERQDVASTHRQRIYLKND